MTDCLFCKIVAKEIFSNIIFEDEDYLAFLDVKPFNEGHTLLVPKTHYRWVNDVPDFGSYWQVAHQLSLAISQAVCADYISYLTVGNEVPHAHIHIIPRFYNDALTAGIVGSSRQVVSLTSLDSVALKIKAYL